MSANSNVIREQVQKLEKILQAYVGVGDQYALIDFPDHSNVGDSAIWLGEVELLKKITGNTPVYVSDLHNFDHEELQQKLPRGPIFIHGGGNFGDIWRSHQDFREKIITIFPDRKIVQLPQSIKFFNEQSVLSTADIISKHKNFHLLVRDQKSHDLATEHFKCEVVLSPDSAFGLGQLKRYSSQSRFLWLLRTDSEKNDSYSWDMINSKPDMGIFCDWLDDGRSFKFKYNSYFVLNSIKHLFKNNSRFELYQAKAYTRVVRGLKTLSLGEQVITDRLHAHILSTLLDIPHYVLDNNYGKISGYINSWTKGYSQVTVVSSLDELFQKINKP
jgi:pyruvyl transferase EpsO